ncbi:hypothetical protein ASD64_19925 [Mesorhizobium sp. Root157]|nr:hypothetical protein ASD64_19925 [Mesorhizobium sp. Root157]
MSKVRHTTAMLLQKRGEDADLYWKQVISANRKSLARVGFSDAETEKELRAFFDAVQSELVRAKAIRERNENGAA